MRTKVHFLTFDEVFSTLRTLGFDVQGVPGVANQFLVSKYGAGAVLAKAVEPGEAEKKLPSAARPSGVAPPPSPAPPPVDLAP